MKKTNSIITIIFLLLLVSFTLVEAQSASFTFQNQLFFTGSSFDPGTLYQDAIGGNLDVGLEICGLGQQFVGSTYAINVGGTWQYSLISYASSSNALSNADTISSGNCFVTSPGLMTLSPSELTTPSPNVNKAAFPGNLWIAYASSANPGTLTNFVFGGSNARLRGSYSVPRSFSQALGAVTVQTPQITFETNAGTFVKSATDPDFGIASDRQMAMGLCEDDAGFLCSSGQIITTPTFPRQFNVGLPASAINDQVVHNRNIVVNGIPQPICIGANLRPFINQITPDPVYYSQDLNVTFRITNQRNTPFEIQGGNVQVTSSFNVRVTIFESSNPSNIVFNDVISINDNLLPDAEVIRAIQWPAFAQSGVYTVRVEADVDNDIVECDESNNVVTQQFELLPITIATVNIDGNESLTFPFYNIPYNLSLLFTNSDGLILSNANVSMTEINGLSLMAPTQFYNHTLNSASQRTGIVTENKINFVTNDDGQSKFTFIPTLNYFYNDEYSHLDIESYLGNHSLYLTGVQSDGQEFIFIEDQVINQRLYFEVQNSTKNVTTTQKPLPHVSIVSQSMDFIYNTFSNFVRILAGI